MNMELNETKEILNKNGFVLKERFVNVDEIRVPEWLWAAYETGDTSNLEDEEIVILHIFEKDHKKQKIKNTTSPFDLVIPQSEVNAFSNRQKMLDDSFEAAFNDEKADYEMFFPTFEQLKASVRKLDFKGCFVDVSRSRERVNFNLSFNGGLFVSLAKTVDSTESNDVMFSISRNKRKIIISQMDVDELIEKIKDVQEIIKEAET